jgi:hypothetical protein
MTTFDKETIRKWRRGTHLLHPAVGDKARDVLDELTRLQGVNAELLDALETYVGKFGNCGRAYEAARQAIEKARKT